MKGDNFETPDDFRAWRSAHDETLTSRKLQRDVYIRDRVIRYVKDMMRRGKGFDEACEYVLRCSNYGIDNLTKAEVKIVLQELGWSRQAKSRKPGAAT